MLHQLRDFSAENPTFGELIAAALEACLLRLCKRVLSLGIRYTKDGGVRPSDG